jgi:hypothetical protein
MTGDEDESLKASHLSLLTLDCYGSSAAAGGEVGAYLLTLLGMPVSSDGIQGASNWTFSKRKNLGG